MEKVDLSRYEAAGILGSGADYEVRAAVDRETGKQVVLKRPKPQMVARQLHAAIEARTDRILQVYEQVGHAIPTVVPILGYTERAIHDAYFGETLGQEYRVTVEERARGIPLVGDPMARITGVPIGVGQNLFTLFPLVQPDGHPPFAIHQQILALEEEFYRAGYILLDLRPQNVFYQPASGLITIIDCGALVEKEGQPDPRGRPPREIHDFYLEMLKFYTTSQQPPVQASDYREPRGLRPVVRFEEELDQMARSYASFPDPLRSAIQDIIARVRSRSYHNFDGFRADLLAYLESVSAFHQSLPTLTEARRAWSEALGWLHGEYWQRFLFDPESELAVYNV